MLYFKKLEDVLITFQPTEKFAKFEEFLDAFNKKELIFEEDYNPLVLTTPSYKSFLKIVLPKKVKIRKHFEAIEGKASLLHTIAHIEYSAVDLALDAALRFKGLPLEYYEDWLVVAQDEIRHFLMLEKLLNELGYKYGDFEVHTNLFEAMKNSQTLVERMAIVPRYLEANGLDQNPKIMEKLKSNPDNINLKILDILAIILEEEIDHVSKGDKWFKFECENLGLNPEDKYLEILEKFYPGATNKKQELNFEARKKAGFSCDELKRLSNKEDCF